MQITFGTYELSVRITLEFIKNSNFLKFSFMKIEKWRYFNLRYNTKSIILNDIFIFSLFRLTLTILLLCINGCCYLYQTAIWVIIYSLWLKVHYKQEKSFNYLCVCQTFTRPFFQLTNKVRVDNFLTL